MPAGYRVRREVKFFSVHNILVWWPYKRTRVGTHDIPLGNLRYSRWRPAAILEILPYSKFGNICNNILCNTSKSTIFGPRNPFLVLLLTLVISKTWKINFYPYFLQGGGWQPVVISRPFKLICLKMYIGLNLFGKQTGSCLCMKIIFQWLH